MLNQQSLEVHLSYLLRREAIALHQESNKLHLQQVNDVCFKASACLQPCLGLEISVGKDPKKIYP